MKNAIGREIPESLPGYASLTPFGGAFAFRPEKRRAGSKLSVNAPHSDKMVKSIDAAIDASGLQDGMTISFHHHFRNGDYVLNDVLAAIARKGIKGLTLAPSSLNDINEVIIPLIEDGTIAAIETSGARGKLGKLMTSGRLAKPVLIRSHGGRARAIECGDLHIDVAFLGAPACDRYGNINGVEGKSACGSMGYAMVDAAFAEKVVAITDNLVHYPLFPISIPQTDVDFIVVVDSIGDPKGIASGALRISSDPPGPVASRSMAASGDRVRGGYFQTRVFGMQLGSRCRIS